ncbi:MBL fold metallo-hydrolase [Paenibacillus sp. sgz500992]|uniref:MBL fold metallo-hydrolase n=1 Tax=Paenibacillus sp. sgz500992 TaxID=3242476 RepID=UPI0036D38806
MTKLTIWGGAGEHGRSSYLLQGKEACILLDCGVKKEGKGEYPLLDAAVIPQLQAVFLSHAHEDHSMALPLLYKYGYKGKVWTTRDTVRQLPGYFEAWSRYAAAESARLPYGDEDKQAMEFMFLDEQAGPRSWLNVAPGLRVQWGRTGHLAGAVWLALEWEGKTVYFSGDYTEESQLLAVDRPQALFLSGPEAGREQGDADLAIIDAAYGADPEEQHVKLLQLETAIRDTLEGGGCVLLPMPLQGRGQELLIWAAERFPQAQLVVEEALLAPLRALRTRSAWLRDEASGCIEQLLNSRNLEAVSSPSERKEALRQRKNKIIFTNDALLQSPTAQWYYRQLLDVPGSHVIFTGHLPEGSFGRNLLGQQGSGSCMVSLIRYKVHQGLPDIRRMLRAVPSHRTVLVHAPKKQTDQVLSILEEEGFTGLYSLLPGDSISF